MELGEKYQVDKLKELAEDKMLQILVKKNMVKFLIAGDIFRYSLYYRASNDWPRSFS